jgi:hypothetical protein
MRVDVIGYLLYSAPAFQGEFNSTYFIIIREKQWAKHSKQLV